MRTRAAIFKITGPSALIYMALLSTTIFAADDIEWAKKQCAEIGFRPKTESFGKCVLQLLRRDESRPATVAPKLNPGQQGGLPPCSSPNSAIWTNCVGELTFPSGQKYVGEFKDGKFNGQGTATLPDGRKYVGAFKDGKYNGQGTSTAPDGSKYVGEFKDDWANGQGTQTNPDGSNYVGAFKDGTFSGQGTLTFSDGRKHVGEFKAGMLSGQGTQYRADGTVLQSGIWENNVFVRSQ